jgi:NADP-dependent 3-hydroxy acid dehydrogenase YdfG
MAEMTYRTALIAGAPSLLARELAMWLGKQGLRVHVAAEDARDGERLEEWAHAVGVELVPVELDTEPEALRARIHALDEACGGLDLMVVAGDFEETPGRDFSWERARRLIDTNVTGAVAALSAVLPRMVARQRGHLAGISSLAAYRGLSGRATYSGSKAFLSNFLESLRLDLKGTGVRVTCLYPGHVRGRTLPRDGRPEPFVLAEDDAAARMGRAILQGKARYALPWQAATFMRLMQVIPGALFDTAARRMR